MKRFIGILIFLTILLMGCESYEIHDGGVYYKNWNEARGTAEKLIEGADANSFTILDNDVYGKDLNKVFYKGKLIPGADPNTFEFIEGAYSKDKSRAYYYGDSIKGSSSKNFRIMDGSYSTDNKDVYLRTEPLNVCSVDDFEFLDVTEDKRFFTDWTTDGCHYFYAQYKIPSDEYDKIKVYPNGSGFATDGKYVYYCSRNLLYNRKGERILDTIDVATFEVDGIDCKDKYGCINVFHGRKNCD